MAMQETAKWFILKQNLHNPRAMVVLVAMPTVLIDTQVRLVLLKFQKSAKATLATTVGLAATEIGVCLLKSLWMRRQIENRRRRCDFSEQQQQQSRGGHLGSSTREACSPPPPPSGDDQQATEAAAFTLWKSQLHQCHTTELVADMYAEYIAIGCSSVMLFVLGDHPQFSFRAQVAATGSVASASIHWQLLVQVAVEALVDFLCCCGEIAGGLSFLSTTQERAFYLVFFITLAVININVSALFYVT